MFALYYLSKLTYPPLHVVEEPFVPSLFFTVLPTCLLACDCPFRGITLSGDSDITVSLCYFLHRIGIVSVDDRRRENASLAIQYPLHLWGLIPSVGKSGGRSLPEDRCDRGLGWRCGFQLPRIIVLRVTELRAWGTVLSQLPVSLGYNRESGLLYLQLYTKDHK
jgi:hypothetical protein